ncbi:MAG: cytochrome c3 family protein, partial [Coriobacteriales bacterium]|nr:cytochrome c3 family protein [Coriobacteriales bacterium]
MKRFVLLLGLVLAMSLVFVGAAYANFGPHGGYITDTDSCAGCHRAHTSFSTVTFDPKVGAELLAPDEKPSALLVGSAATMTEFCNACHGQNAPGASTNVVQGIFDSGPSGSSTQTVGTSNGGVTVAYETNSSFNGPLNGGGFSQMPDPDAAGALRAVSSAHTMEATNVLWGAGSAANQSMNLNCAGCHDPHGSSNYRLLKDSVNGVTVGG